MKKIKAKAQGWRVADRRGKKKNRVPPFAPSQNEVKFYDSYIKRVLKDQSLPNRALTLGATPELRDVAIENGLESFAVDISQKMMDKFSDLMRHKNHDLDIRSIKNWLAMDFPRDYFGIVMADASFVNLATRQENEKLMKILKKIIPTGGFLLTRQVLYSDNYQPAEGPEELVKLYRSKKISWHDFYSELRLQFFKDQAYDKKKFQYDSNKGFKMIKKLHQDGVLNAKEFGIMEEFANYVINTFYPADVFISLANKNNFKLEKVFKDKPFRFYQYLYMIAFKNNKK